MALGIFFGRKNPKQNSNILVLELAKEIHDSFRARHGSICCCVLNKKIISGSDAQKSECLVRTGDAVEITLRILEREIIKTKSINKLICKL